MLWTTVVIFLFCIRSTESQINNKLIMEKIEHISNPKYWNLTYNFAEVDGVYRLNVEVHQKLDSRRKLTARVRLFKLEDDGHYENFLVNSTIPVCKFFKSFSQNMLFKRAFSKVRLFGRIPTSCPLVAGTYYVKKFKLDGELLPPVFVDTKLRANFELFYNDVDPAEPITEMMFFIVVLRNL